MSCTASDNLTNHDNKVYTYTQANRLITVTAPGLTWSTTYNGDGARLRQTVNPANGSGAGGVETAYTLDLAAPLVTVLAQQEAGGKKQYVYGQGDSPLAGYDGTAWTYLSGRDGINSVRQETDASGNVLAVRGFDPYGVPLSGNAGQPFGYTGEVWDASTQLVFLRARYYTPTTGRFVQADPSQLEYNLYLYTEANPVTFTDPAGTCKYQAGDPPDTCRVERGDNLYNIALANGIPQKDWEQIKAWNPEVAPTYTIYRGNLIYLRARNAVQSPQGGSPLDTISGYLEGRMESSTLACITWDVRGEEIVYDFAQIPPERARFTYRGFGISSSLLDATVVHYAGYIWGFNPDDSADIFTDYEGPTISGSAGATVTPVGFFSFGGGVGGFKSLTSQVFGFVAYTSAGVGASTPGVDLTISFLGTYYTGDYSSWHPYGTRQQPARGMHSAISTGEGSPVKDNLFIRPTRQDTADHVYRVLERYYATKRLTPSR